MITMTTHEKLELIEKVLQTKPDTLNEGMRLNSLPMWDSLTMLSLQVEFTAVKPDVQFDQLSRCDTVGDLCKLI
jgi:aryl carrier-like protein